jgi:hypothetical protein
MRRITSIGWALLATLVTFAFALHAQSVRPAPPSSPPELHLRISTARHTYKNNSEIPISVQITNIGSRNILVGRDLLRNTSPSQLAFYVTPADRHALSYEHSVVDGLPAHALDDLPSAILRWCLSLQPGYSYGVTIPLDDVVVASGLTPGVYHVHVEYISSGIDENTYFNPLLGHPDELAHFLDDGWKGRISSNKITFKIVPDK